MKQIINNIFVTLGVIFLIFIIASLWFFIEYPYNIKPMLFGTPYTPTQNANVNTKTTATSTNGTAVEGSFNLSDAQKQALISFGINPATVPSSINAQQEACFVSVLGQARVLEIKAGAVPNGIEFFKAKACI